MNVNIKLSITDLDRNLIARKLAGKNVKRMVSRKEVNELVAGFMEGLLSDLEEEHIAASSTIESCDRESATMQSVAAPDLSCVPKKFQDKPVQWQVGYARGWAKVGSGRSY